MPSSSSAHLAHLNSAWKLITLAQRTACPCCPAHFALSLATARQPFLTALIDVAMAAIIGHRGARECVRELKNFYCIHLSSQHNFSLFATQSCAWCLLGAGTHHTPHTHTIHTPSTPHIVVSQRRSASGLYLCTFHVAQIFYYWHRLFLATNWWL